MATTEANGRTDPMRAQIPEFDADKVRDIAAAHRHREGALLPILHELQRAFGCIDARAEPIIAEVLNLTRAEVHGIVTFYHDHRREPAGRYVDKLCRAEACQAAGGEELAERAEAALGCILFVGTGLRG